MNVAFVGLGRMGRGMAHRLVTGPFDLVVYNRTRERALPLGEAGARVADTVASACAGRDVVISMLADDAALNEVALGPGGLRDSLAEGAIHLTMGTHGVAMIRALAAAHRASNQTLVAAPVLGRPDLAAAGHLSVVAGGPAAAVARCEPLFQLMGRRTFEAGEVPDAASLLKLVNNFVLGCAIEVMAEGFSLVRKHGGSPQTLYDVLTEGLFSAPAYKVYGKIIADESYEGVGITARLGLKDANLVMAAAEMAAVPLPSANAWRDRLLGAIAHGDGDRDWAVIAREQKRASGLE